MAQRPGWREWPWLILAGALALRLGALVWSGAYQPFGDPFEYDQLARSILDDGRYRATLFAEPGSPSAVRPPGYPLWLTGVYAIFGKSADAARVVGALLGTLTVGLVWRLALQVAGRRVARWAAGAAALAPSLVWTSGGLVAETLYLPLLLGAVLLVARHTETPSWRWAAAAGLVLGLSVMTRANGLVVLLPVIAAVWLARRRWQDAVALACAFALALVPWTVRNAVALDAFLPLGTQTGITMIGVYNADATGSIFYGVYRPPDDIPELAPLLFQPGTTEADLDAEFRRRAIDFAADHPDYVARVTLRHVQQLLELRHQEVVGPLSHGEQAVPEGFARELARGGFLVLLALGLAGAALALRRRIGPLWLWSVPVLLLVTMAPLQGAPRYRLPVDPFLAVLAGIALAAAAEALRRRRTFADAPG